MCRSYIYLTETWEHCHKGEESRMKAFYRWCMILRIYHCLGRLSAMYFKYSLLMCFNSCVEQAGTYYRHQGRVSYCPRRMEAVTWAPLAKTPIQSVNLLHPAWKSKPCCGGAVPGGRRMRETHTEMLRDMLHVIGWVRDDMAMESCLLLAKYMTCLLQETDSPWQCHQELD